MRNRVEIKQLTDDYAIVAGYGVVFGGADLVGDCFTADTDFRLELVPNKPVFYDHTLELPQRELGHVVKIVPDSQGLWIEAQLDRYRDYVEEVLRLIEQGALGWSSGTIGHLVRREGETGVIKSWPLIEMSLTPQPCEPRTLGVQRVKARAEEGGKVMSEQMVASLQEEIKGLNERGLSACAL